MGVLEEAMGTCEWEEYRGLMCLEFSVGVTSEEVSVAPHPVCIKQ